MVIQWLEANENNAAFFCTLMFPRRTQVLAVIKQTHTSFYLLLQSCSSNIRVKYRELAKAAAADVTSLYSVYEQWHREWRVSVGLTVRLRYSNKNIGKYTSSSKMNKLLKLCLHLKRKKRAITAQTSVTVSKVKSTTMEKFLSKRIRRLGVLHTEVQGENGSS